MFARPAGLFASMLKLAFGFSFSDLHSVTGLQRLDAAFRAWLAEADAALASRLAAACAAPGAPSRRDESALLVELAPELEDWLGQLFGIEAELRALQAAQH